MQVLASFRPPLALALIASLAAQAPQPVPAKAELIRFDATTMVLPAGKHELRAVVDATARFLKRNILCDDHELESARHQIELQSPLSLEAKGCEEAVSQLLYSCDLVLVPRDLDHAIYEVILLSGPRGREAFSSAPQRSVEAILAQPHLQQPVSTVLKLKQVNATVATNALRPFFAQAGPGQGVSFGTAGTNDALVIAGLQSKVADAIQMVRRIDGDEEPPPTPAEAKGLAEKIAVLERTVQQLTQRLATLEQQLTGKK